MTRQHISTNKQTLLRSSHAKRLPQSGFVQVLVLYRKREEARRGHEHGVFARFRYNDLKEAGRGCGGRGRYANSMVGKSGVEVQLGCAAARHR
jgi:hypothetical protein